MRERLEGLGEAARLSLFTLGLVVVLVAGLGVGAATGDQGGSGGSGGSAPAMTDHGAGASDHAASGADHEAAPAADLGTSSSAEGLHLDAPVRVLQPLVRTPFSFTVRKADGTAVTAFEVEQGKQLHLLVVERDLLRYAHLHPTMAADGTWSADLTLSPGSYRVVADSTVEGVRRALAVDVVVPGAVTASPLPPPAPTARVDGLDVALDRQGDRLAFTVTRDGAPADLEPYLGARGHLVVFRAGDLAYTHVHPVTQAAREGTTFEAALPGPGTYRLFLEVQTGGRVSTAAFTLERS